MKAKILSFVFLLSVLTIVCGPAISAGFYDTNAPRKAKCSFPKMEKGEDYLKLRKRLLRAGLSLDPEPNNLPYSGCNELPRICHRFPELIGCATDQPFCRLRFIDKAGTVLEVVTEGDESSPSFVFGGDVFCAKNPAYRSP